MLLSTLAATEPATSSLAAKSSQVVIGVCFEPAARAPAGKGTIVEVHFYQGGLCIVRVIAELGIMTSYYYYYYY